jgi:hypothetical protein
MFNHLTKQIQTSKINILYVIA